MTYGISSRFLCAAMVLGALTLNAEAQVAQNPTSLGKSGDWEAFTYTAEDSKVCYVFSSPVKSEATRKSDRGPIYFMITHWPSRKVRGQPSTFIGYTFKEGSGVSLKVDEKNFDLYPVDNMAWTDKVETEKSILNAMKTGKSMKIKGTSARGTETVDTYSLNGLSAAVGKIDSACK